MRKKISDLLLLVAGAFTLVGLGCITAHAIVTILGSLIFSKTAVEVLKALFLMGMIAANTMTIESLLISRYLLEYLLESSNDDSE